jgi:hypothetical protein
MLGQIRIQRVAPLEAIVVVVDYRFQRSKPSIVNRGTSLGGGILSTCTHTFSYSNLALNLDEADIDGDTLSFRVESVPSGTLTKNGVAVVVGTTTVSSGESLVWTPAANTLGTVTAYTLKAFDGSLTSSGIATVSIDVQSATNTLGGWASTFGLSGTNATQDADPDNDGVGNAIEYVLGRNPTVSDVCTNPTTPLLAAAASP